MLCLTVVDVVFVVWWWWVYDGNTPLFYACKYKHLEVISCLLEHGADVNMKNKVSTATSGALNSGVAVMVEMVVCGGEG
jgi:ankyrin repeat protein